MCSECGKAYISSSHLVLNKVGATNAEKPTLVAPTLFSTRKFTLERDLMSAMNVGNSLATTPSSFYTREFTLEKSLTCAMNVGRPIAEAPILFGTRKLTLEKDLMNTTVLVTL